jgi:hypothetical protein
LDHNSFDACILRAPRWRLLKRGSPILKMKLQTLGKKRSKMPQLVSTPTLPELNLDVLFTLIHIIATEHIGGPPARKRKNPLPTHMASPPKRTRVNGSSLIINGKPRHFRSGYASFPEMLMQNGRAYFDRTRYISVLEDIDNVILFCRPPRFGKSLTISMLEHFHGLQYADEHQTCYKVCHYILDYLNVENLLFFQSL